MCPDRALAANDFRRHSGIALMVVLIVFVVLYLIVFQLQYWTGMEEKLAEVRSSESESQDALYSGGLYAMVLLLEDLKQDVVEAGQSGDAGGAGGAGGAGAGGLPPGIVTTPGQNAGQDDGSGNFVPIDPRAMSIMGGGDALRHQDYLRETLFNPSVQSIGDVQVKISVRDNEGRLDLDRLFEYAQKQLQAAEASEGLSGLGENDLVDAVAGSPDTESASQSLRDRILSRTSQIGSGGEREGEVSGGRGGSRGSRARPGDLAEDEVENLAGSVAGQEDERDLAEFEPPSPEVLEATRRLVARAILTLMSLNEDRGYYYEATYSADEVAADIVDFVLRRRSAPVHNVIYHTSELLNLYSITPELYYGPRPALRPGEELERDDGFVLKRDEFGDLSAEYLWSDEEVAYREEEKERLADAMEQFSDYGNFVDLPIPGLNPLDANSLTRGMAGPVVEVDENDEEYVVPDPLPLGLDDVFCTFSTGMINLNTAPVPVLYAILPSLSEGADGDANYVAVLLDEYRNRFQEEMPAEGEEGVDRVDETPDLGQPRRQAKSEEELRAEEEGADPSEYGLDDLEYAGSTYQDLETNYFTSLEQVELIDGTDGGPEDRLSRENSGVDRVSSEQDSLYQRVLNDLRPVAVFGSTYFTVELKARTENSPLVKSGVMIVKRDSAAELMEVILWKELGK